MMHTEETVMSKVFLEFSEGPDPYERELTEAEAAKLGLKMIVHEVQPNDLASIRARQVESYKAMGMNEAEAQIAVSLGTSEREPHGLGLRF
jgi:hypothetical protein